MAGVGAGRPAQSERAQRQSAGGHFRLASDPDREPPAPTFAAADVDAVVEDPRFYANGHVYFNGIWAQAAEAPPGQPALLKILAGYRNGLDRNAWREQSGLDPVAFEAALEALAGHDVVTCEDGVCRYSVELMRRWVAGYAAA